MLGLDNIGISRTLIQSRFKQKPEPKFFNSVRDYEQSLFHILIGRTSENEKSGARLLATKLSRGVLSLAIFFPLRRGFFRFWPCRQFGDWGEGKRKRAGNAGKGKREERAPRLSVFPSSQAHLVFSPIHLPHPLEERVFPSLDGLSWEERLL